MKARLTASFIAGIPLPEKQLLVWDEVLPGFGLRVTPTGAKSYVIQYRDAAGRSRRVTLGRQDLLGLEEARRAARQNLAKVVLGGDPRRAKGQAEHTPDFRDLADRYCRQHAQVHKKARSVHEDRRLLKSVLLPRFGSRPVAEITRAEVADLHYALLATPILANRALALLSKMFNLAEVWEYRPDGTNPCRHIRRYPEAKRERYLSGDELVRLGEILTAAEKDGRESPAAVLAIRLILLTGARHSEILTLRWADVSEERGSMILPDSKTGRKEIVLAGPAVQLLQRARLGAESSWVVPGRDPSQHRYSLNGPWRRLRIAAGIPDVRIHDLRHTYASTAVGLGLGLPVLAGLLGQTQLATTQRYAHLDLDPRRRAAEAVAGQLDHLLRTLQDDDRAA